VRMRPKRCRGFTMVELMVAVTVLALLIFVAMPSFAEWMRAMRVRDVSGAFQTGLVKARQEAVRRNRSVTFWIVSPSAAGTLDNSCALASASSAWVVSLENPEGKCANTDPAIVAKYSAGQAAAAALIATDSGGTSSVTFNALGLRDPSSTLRAIDVSQSDGKGRRLRVSISSMGAIRLCDRDVATTDPRACS
jgi:type IV fimbrial biogenesis protein FimT